MISFLKLYKSVPEYGRYDDTKKDIETLTEWYFDYEDYTEQQKQEFQKFLNDMPIGVEVKMENKQETLIKVKLF